MKPMLALHVREGIDLDAEQVAEAINYAMDREFTAGVVDVRVLANEEELRAYQAGELVLYRKPARKVGNRYVYQKDGVTHVLEQETLFAEAPPPAPLCPWGYVICTDPGKAHVHTESGAYRAAQP